MTASVKAPQGASPRWVEAYQALVKEAVLAGWKAPQRHLSVAGMRILIPH